MSIAARAAGWLVGVASLGCPLLAGASPEYPTIVRDDLMLSKTPDCTLCHANDLGGTDTISSYFGRTLLREGGHGNDDVAALKLALDAMDEMQVDSDGDGVSDIDELRMNTDPNDGPGPAESLPTPRTGCSFRAAPYDSHPFYSWLPSVLLTWVFGRKAWRRRSISADRKPENDFR